MYARTLYSLLIILTTLSVSAVPLPHSDPAFDKILREIRCPSCPAQPLSESRSEPAQAMKQILYQRWQQNPEPQALLLWIQEQYGAAALYHPPLQSNTLLLWMSPFGLGMLLLFGLRRLYQGYSQ